jgi:hypothetical protein
MMYQQDRRVRRDCVVRQAAEFAIETLEKRVLLTVMVKGAFDLNNIPRFTSTSTSVTDIKDGPLAKSGGILAGVYSEYQQFTHGGASGNGFVSRLNKTLIFKGSSVAVTVRTRGGMPELADLIHSLGGELMSRASQFRAINAYVPVANLVALDRNATITSANPIYRPIYRAGVADNQGDRGQNADEARIAFDVDGTGVKVGVLSDSVNSIGGGLSDSVTTGDLPSNVEVYQDAIDAGFQGNDEGRAMLEQIHDIAPGASLAFSTTGLDELTFARNITALADLGANVIVDDVGFPTEPYFQDGVAAQAITAATVDHDVVYLSAAGNNFDSGFEAPTNWYRSPNGETLVDFDPGPGVDTRMTFDLINPAVFGLQWDNPYNGVIGAATSDLDIRFYDHETGAIIGEGADDNLATGLPLEMTEVPGPLGIPSSEKIDVEIVAFDTLPGAELPTRFRFATGQPESIGTSEYEAIRNGTTGHSASKNAVGVGAVPFYLTHAFQQDTEVRNESFSATGPVTQIFDGNGNRLAKPITLLKPDLSGVDGVDTSFFGEQEPRDGNKLRNFFGTSSAAPNVAALAALMRQVNSSATSQQVRDALIGAAKSNPINGQKPKHWDEQAGWGLVDGLTAAWWLKNKNPVSDIVDVFPHAQPGGPDSINITFSEPVEGFDISDLSLTRNDGSNLLGDGQTLTTSDDITFALSGLSAVDSSRGRYRLRLDTANGGITNADGLSPRPSSETFVVTGKPTGVQATPVGSNEIDVTWNDNITGETGYKIYRADDPGFTTHVKTFTVPADTSKFKNMGLLANYQYYYKVKAIMPVGAAASPVSPKKTAFTTASNEVIVDNAQSKFVTVDGTWDPVNSTDGWSTDYLVSTDDSATVTFTPRVPTTGKYFVYARWVPGSDRASNASVTVAGKPLIVDQRKGTGWQLLGTYALNKGTGTSVVFDAAGANGVVVADAVRFQMTSGGVTISSAAATRGTFNDDTKITDRASDLPGLI